MLIKCLPVGHLMTNCYIVTDETTLECAVIDPGDESNTILYYLEDNHLTCRAILLTHGHYDHTGAVYAVHEETGAPVYMNALDAGTAVAFDSYTFTLFADCRSRRPGFTAAARPETAVPLYERVIAGCEARGFPVRTGVFGADMKVASVNDGPVTILLDTDHL